MGEQGYSISEILSSNDLLELRSRINKQILNVLREVDPKTLDQIASAGDPLCMYHTIDSGNKHGSNWIKSNRMLSEEDTRWFEACESLKHLRKRFNCKCISDEENIGRSNYYWRLTRPFALEDVGPIHRDEWFWILNNNFNADLGGLKRIKVWIAIQTVPGKNGLLVQPKSHRRQDLKWEGKSTDSIKKPILLTHIDPNSMQLLATPPGHGVIFHDKLLHGGALNQAGQCRCSIEFTMLVPDDEI